MTPDTSLRPGHAIRERWLTAENLAARALLVATLDEAAPRILEAICQSLGWDHGALWRSTARPACCAASRSGTRRARSPEFDAASRASTFVKGVGLPGRVWASGEPAWIPDVTATRTSRARRSRRARGCTRRSASRSCSAAKCQRPRVLQPRDPRARRRRCCRCSRPSATQIGMFIERRRAEEELDRFFTLSLDMLVHRRLRRVLQAREPGVDSASSAGRRRGAPRRGRTWSSSTPTIAQPTIAAAAELGRGEHGDPFREPLPAQGRHVPVAAVGRRAGRRSSRSSTPSRTTSPSARRPRRRSRTTRATSRPRIARSRIRPRGSRSWSASSKSPSGAPKRRRRRRARSSPT